MTQDIIVVKQLPVIEDQLREVKASIQRRVNEALSMACTEDTYKTVKKIRAELNKEYKELEDRRKEVKAAILAPYEKFNALYEECAGNLYSDADAQLKGRITEVEDGLKSQRAVETEAYFNEYLKSINIPDDFITFTSSGIKVSLSESRKAMYTKVRAVLDRIAEDLALIETQEHKEEILVEYRKLRNVSQAVTAVDERHKAMEAERQRREQAAADRAARAAARSKVEQIVNEDVEIENPPVSTPVEAPAAAPVSVAEENIAEEEKVFSTAFRVNGTLDQLRALKQFLEDGGYSYEQL